MNIANFFGLRPFLMNEADGGEGGGGGGNAVATVETSLATTDDGTGADETALTTTSDDGPQRDVDASRKLARHPALEVLSTHENPEVKKFANTVIRDRAFRREIGLMFPGGNPKTAIQSLVSDMVGLAGRNWNTPDPRDATRRTGLQQVRDSLAEIEEIDLMFYGGNPQLLDGMTGDDEGKAAFAKLAPNMLRKWQEIAPNAWAATVSRQILADLKGAQLTDDKGNYIADADIPLRVQRLTMALGKDGATPTELDLKLARNEIAAVALYLQRLNGLTALAPEVFTPASDANDSKLAERERRIAEREANSRNTEWNNARQIVASQITTKTWNQLTKGHDIPADDQEECIALFQRRFNQKIEIGEGKGRADQNRQSYVEGDDRDGYLAYEQYLMNTYGVPALKEQVKRMLAKMAPAKPGQRAAATAPANGQPAAAKPPAAGFVKLMAKPPSHVIDYARMTPEMVKAKQAVLRLPHGGKPAGTRVTW